MANDGVGYSLAGDLPPTDNRLTKFAKQRAERGFDDTETWSLASTIAAFVLPRLKRFREVSQGHPADRTEEQWTADLDEMIWAFQQIVDDESWSFEEAERLTDALRKFGDQFMNLWW